MIIIRLIGGLGNQMFQYAFGRALAKEHTTELKIDINYLHGLGSTSSDFVPRKYSLDIFNINEQFATQQEVNAFTKRAGNPTLDRFLNKLLGSKKSYIRELEYGYSPALKSSSDNVLLEGYWQTEKYFSPVINELKDAFTFRQPPAPACRQLLDEIRTTNSVCVHVRRGDFLTNPNHGFCGLPYYEQAGGIIKDKVTDPAYFVFSDEIDWCRENMHFLPGARFIPQELAGHKDQDHLRMMSQCKHFIIPNSSFAWWGVWLAKNDNAVVAAPRNWYKPTPDVTDMYQPGWIVL